ncbi:uncharacterized protein K460DRAFT_111936 [Cucurbitaria berberidis CBS 394.84]|uniref:Uncharacterized protein n=1 Tax=Cucurbitaria berberidis CBS 394.84 TaxID=1168544 RepID=A0A9P4GIA1_9PLEO|nr:uncharacterized protein K460DRAFT_111936 [Cucurbitaria berberidis CBS 394.84]KAF1845635.1 hypothetical protein K460DRAFT_111936 [Cucurbitaria berberidis CBS 394.84]
MSADLATPSHGHTPGFKQLSPQAGYAIRGCYCPSKTPAFAFLMIGGSKVASICGVTVCCCSFLLAPSSFGTLKMPFAPSSTTSL